MNVNYAALAATRVISQYRNDDKLNQFLRLMGNMISSEIEFPANIMKLMYNIDFMPGAYLDLIGRVLVQPRPRVIPDSLSYFGFEGMPGATGYDASPYYNFNTAGSVSVPLPDELYKKLLKAKAAKNNTACYIDDIIKSAAIITGDTDIQLVNGHDMSFSLIFSVAPDAYTTLMLNQFDIIPEPVGVNFSGWSVAP